MPAAVAKPRLVQGVPRMDVEFRNPDLFYYSPEEIFRIAKQIAPRVVIRHDYRAFEFCVQLYHADVEDYIR